MAFWKAGMSHVMKDASPKLLERLEKRGFLRPRRHHNIVNYPSSSVMFTSLFYEQKYNEYMRVGFMWKPRNLTKCIGLYYPIALTMTGSVYRHCFDIRYQPQGYDKLKRHSVRFVAEGLSLSSLTARKAMRGTPLFRFSLEKDKQYYG